jgi:hypothetical protein
MHVACGGNSSKLCNLQQEQSYVTDRFQLELRGKISGRADRLSSGILYGHLQSVTIPDAVIIQFVLLKIGVLMLETCRGL